MNHSSPKSKDLKRVGLALMCVCVLAVYLSAQAQQTIKVDVNLVSIIATVKDQAGNFVTDLTKDDFRVYENDQPQEIQIFEKQDKVDSSIGLLMDASGSMVDILPYMKRGVRDFTKDMPKDDEFFIASFGAAVKLIHSSTQTQKHLDEGFAAMRAWGTSVLFDGLLYGALRVERSARPRKALIIFTDGNDNGSKVGHGRIVREVQNSALLLYFIAIGSPILVDSHTLTSLSDISGGRTFHIAKQESLSPVLDQIRAELAQQYYLAYYVPKKEGFHKLRVETPGRNLRIRAKTGYNGN